MIVLLGIALYFSVKTANLSPVENCRKFPDEKLQFAKTFLKTADFSRPAPDCALLAAYAADGDALKKLHDHGFDRWNDPQIIINASVYGSEEVIKLLISYGADIKARANNGESVLHGAVRGGNIKSLEYFLNSGIDIQARDNHGRTALYMAALHGNYRMFHCLRGRGADVFAKDNFGGSLLHPAVAGGNIEIVKYLERCGLDINEKNNSGFSLLHTAASGGNLEMLLLS